MALQPASVAGYGVLSVYGCNGALSGSTYTTGSITGDCAVSVTTVKRNGNSGATADPIIADALKALQSYSGMVSLTKGMREAADHLAMMLLLIGWRPGLTVCCARKYVDPSLKLDNFIMDVPGIP